MTTRHLTKGTRSRRRRAAFGSVLVVGGYLAATVYGAPAVPHPSPAKRAVAPRLTVRVVHAVRTVDRGRAVAYRVSIGRTERFARRPPHTPRPAVALVRLSVGAPLPRGMTATFSARATRSRASTLTLRTRTSMRPGRYRVQLNARGLLRVGRHHFLRHARLVVTVVVTARGNVGAESAQPGAFAIDGTLGNVLAPGVGSPLDLRLTNRQGVALKITQLGVRVGSVRAPRADAAHPCTVADFVVLPFSGPYGFVLPASGSWSLSALGIPAAHWPHVAMTNRPANQDGCKSAALTLSFSGLATEG
jgi:hypothetical protein